MGGGSERDTPTGSARTPERKICLWTLWITGRVIHSPGVDNFWRGRPALAPTYGGTPRPSPTPASIVLRWSRAAASYPHIHSLYYYDYMIAIDRIPSLALVSRSRRLREWLVPQSA
jgi:hypothetical protein